MLHQDVPCSSNGPLIFIFLDGSELLRIFFFISHGLIRLHFPPTVRFLGAGRIWKKRVALKEVRVFLD